MNRPDMHQIHKDEREVDAVIWLGRCAAVVLLVVTAAWLTLAVYAWLGRV